MINKIRKENMKNRDKKFQEEYNLIIHFSEKFCGNCRYGNFFHKDKPCINCKLIPSQFLTKKEIIDEDMPMGRLDRRELIRYRKIEQKLKYLFKNLVKELKETLKVR